MPDASSVSTVAGDAAVILSAAVASAINSMAGGGTFLSFPALTGFGRLGEKAANMTSTVGLWPGSAASIVAAKTEFRFIPRGTLAGMCVVSLAGGVLGSLLLLGTSSTAFRLIVPWLLLFATLVFAFSKRIARWSGHQHGDRSLKWTLVVLGIQFLIAVYGGYFGAGIGVLMLAGLAFSGIEDIHTMNALKVLLATLINGAAVVIFVSQSVILSTPPTDRIHWPFALGMAGAAIVGGFFGMRVARRIPQRSLRGLILTVATGLTVIYFWRAYFH